MIYTVHQTDLFRPHQDPDDHYDLACQYALQKQGLIKLMGIMLDSPPDDPLNGDPDVQAVMQLSHITGNYAAMGVGASEKGQASGASALLMDMLSAAPEPLKLHVIGSCRDVAYTISHAPELVREKCAAIYLNAGAAEENGRVEYNVALDPESFSQVMNAPCPVYWLPCFDSVPDWGREDMQVGRYGTFYRFTQGDVLSSLSPQVKNFFLSMLRREEECRWIERLKVPLHSDELNRFSQLPRNMWCTAGFLHAAGQTVWLDGTIAPLNECADREVFTFLPISASCSISGAVLWQQGENTNRYLFEVRDEALYPAAMTKALVSLLQVL